MLETFSRIKIKSFRSFQLANIYNAPFLFLFFQCRLESGDKRAAKKWREKVESQASTINCFFSNNNGTSFHLTSLGNIFPLSLCPSPLPSLFPIDMCRIFLPPFSSHCTLHSAHCVCAQQQQCLSINQLPPPPLQQNCSETCPHHLASSSSAHSMLQSFFQHYFYYYTT